ncbi:MAG: hypothetical protein M3R25_05810 [Bacteroidota bacterium]|nr:hypothetical protein [Bacteroidota bacterium]
MVYQAMIMRVSIVIGVLLMGAFSLHAQIRPGIKFGLSTPDVQPKSFIVTNDQGVNLYEIFVDKARYGLHGGVFVQMQLGGFFIQPEVLFNSTNFRYRVDSLLNGGGNDLFTDTYRNIDFPIIVGLKAGAVRVGGGPVGHLFLDSDSGFGKYSSFNPLLDDLTWGWQAGLGFDFWKLHIDFRYEGNFSRLGDHISFFGKEYDFATNNNRIKGSLGFSF